MPSIRASRCAKPSSSMMMTWKKRGPWAPRVSVRSTSAVREGPVMRLTVRGNPTLPPRTRGLERVESLLVACEDARGLEKHDVHLGHEVEARGRLGRGIEKKRAGLRDAGKGADEACPVGRLRGALREHELEAPATSQAA